jgi:hypothetical protein
VLQGYRAAGTWEWGKDAPNHYGGRYGFRAKITLLYFLLQPPLAVQAGI